jgi:hypothetical protein
MEPAFLQAKKIIQKAHENCRPMSAWNENSQKFARCTEQLKSTSWLGAAFEDIENFVAGNMNSSMPIEAQIGQLGKMTISIGMKQTKTNGIETAIQNIKHMSDSITTSKVCSEIPGCQEKVRRTILQLLMMEWGIMGLGDVAAGLFLVNHYSFIGPYFGSTDGPNWPHTPLSKEPSLQESYLHKEMMRITEVLSKGKLKHISILDLPAFGSKIAHLEWQHKRISNWPSEVSFSILDELQPTTTPNPSTNNQTKVSLQTAFENYKILIDHWKSFMQKVYMKDLNARFSPEMENNYLFDFTKYIREDMKTFLIAHHGSVMMASKEAMQIWEKVADESFNQTRSEHTSSKVGMYDKLVMQYAFKENILKKQQNDYDGGSELFTPTLTTNGLCYSFNSENYSSVWKESEVTNNFNELFPHNSSAGFFQGAEVTDGEILIQVFFYK